MEYLNLTIGNSDPGSGDIVGFDTLQEAYKHVQWMARGGASKVIIFKKTDVKTLAGNPIWIREDEFGGKRLKDLSF